MERIIRHEQPFPPELRLNPGAKDFTYYCSPLRSTSPSVMFLNMTLALAHCGMLTEEKNALGTVIAPHAFLPPVFNDTDTKLREAALAFGKELIMRSRGLYVATLYVRLSEGMVSEIAFAAELGKPVDFENPYLLQRFRDMRPELSNKVRLSPRWSHNAEKTSASDAYFSICAHEADWYVDAAYRMAEMLLDSPEKVLPREALRSAYYLALKTAKEMS